MIHEQKFQDIKEIKQKKVKKLVKTKQLKNFNILRCTRKLKIKLMFCYMSLFAIAKLKSTVQCGKSIALQ